MTLKEKNFYLQRGDLVFISSKHKVLSLTQQIIIEHDQKYLNYVISEKNNMPNFEEVINLDNPEIALVLDSFNTVFYYGSYLKIFLPSKGRIVFARSSQLVKINSIFEIIIYKKK